MPIPVPHNTADRKTVNRYISDTTTAIPLHVAAGYSIGYDSVCKGTVFCTRHTPNRGT